MKMMDCVEIIAEKEKYIKNGVHKGMQGWICLDDCTNGLLAGKFSAMRRKG